MRAEPGIGLEGAETDLLAPSMALARRAAGACPGLDPGAFAFAFAILQTQSGSTLRAAPE